VFLLFAYRFRYPGDHSYRFEDVQRTHNVCPVSVIHCSQITQREKNDVETSPPKIFRVLERKPRPKRRAYSCIAYVRWGNIGRSLNFSWQFESSSDISGHNVPVPTDTQLRQPLEHAVLLTRIHLTVQLLHFARHHLSQAHKYFPYYIVCSSQTTLHSEWTLPRNHSISHLHARLQVNCKALRIATRGGCLPLETVSVQLVALEVRGAHQFVQP